MRKMKSSGDKWIGDIPSDWDVTRIGYESWIRARLGWKGLKAEEYVDEGFAFLSAFNIVNDKLQWENLNYINQQRYDESPEIKLKKGDILLVKDGAGIGKCGRVDSLPKGAATTNGSLAVISSFSNLSYRYLYFYLISPIFQNYIYRLMNGMGVPHLSQEELRKIQIPFPPIAEQKRIADYLDGKCADIDQIRADVEKQIEILTDYKKSIITEAVTKGLDPKAKVKDSGIKWIGKIPNDWTLTKIGNMYSLRSEKVSDKVFAPLSVTKNGVLPQLENVAKTDDGDNRKLVRKGDFVINSRSDRRGSCGISNLDGSVSLINTVLKPRNEMNPRYYNWLFHTDSFADEFYSWGHGIVDDLWTTRWQEMKNILIPVPTSIEQENIAQYLDEKCSEIDATIAEKQKQIETLEEYKKSLIFEYVTGKKEVV